MIKLFKNKMLIALFLLVIGISVTSFCYAFDLEYPKFDSESHYTVSNYINKYKELGGSEDLSTMSFFELFTNNGYFGYFVDKNVAYFMLDNTGSTQFFLYGYDFNGNQIALNCIYVQYGTSFDGWQYIKNESLERIFIPNLYNYYTQSELSVYYKNTGELLFEGSYTEDLTQKKIVYEITYDEDNKKAQINASIKNAAEGDKLYYSTLGFKLNGKLLIPHEIAQNDISYIPVSENGLIHLQALDSERQYYRYSWY